MSDVIIHPTADVSTAATLGAGTRVWHEAQIRERATLGRECIVGKGAYIDFGVQVGDRVKIQNGAYLYHGLTVGDGVFIGPRVCFTNDLRPRAIAPDGSLKSDDDWEVGETTVRHGASLGAGAVVLPGVQIGRFALVGAGAVVINDVDDHVLVVGNPARAIGHVCACASRLPTFEGGQSTCAACARRYRVGQRGVEEVV